MSDNDRAGDIFAQFELERESRVSDTQKVLYSAFGLGKGNIGQLVGPRVWGRGVAALLRGHGVGKPEGDTLQMPGVFVVHRGRILDRFVHETVADRPDYAALAVRDDRNPESAEKGE